MNDYLDPEAGPDALTRDALAYVSDELSDAQRAAFEERLGADLEACEMVAEMQLYRDLAPARVPALSQCTPRLRWIALAAAAALLVAAGTGWWLFQRSQRENPSPGSELRAPLAEAEAEAEDLLADWLAFGPEQDLELGDLFGNAETNESESELETPDWMLSALEGEDG